MKKLLNTLYVTSENSYLGLDGENIVVYDDKKEIGRLPLHNLEGIVSFGYRGTSPALMGACVEKNISLCYLTPQGKFLARVTGKIKGNVVLRQQQFLSSCDEKISLDIAKNCILGKVYNARWILERAIRDHPMQIDVEAVKSSSVKLKEFLEYIQNANSIEQLRGYEGEAASIYFGVFDELILQQKKDFQFHGRNRRPPLDNVNAMLSFVYTLLSNQITSALEVVGLDPYVGFMHTDRPGRTSLSLDLIEELRAVMADRFVLSLINKKIVNGKNFTQKENGAVLMDFDTRKKLLSEWQNKKKEIITHPYLKEKIEWGMVPYVQAMLLARYLRGDLDAYPVFLWK
ncbi:MAG: type I-C CRISPR-associated endonuclease Cas1c [Agathobacter sp.]|uniref:type I-C CRISPR-associated endonuclease Cas1c n=1 Tax=Agathobacter sp. TaxID=2021311 RepID=UPI00399614B5